MYLVNAVTCEGNRGEDGSCSPRAGERGVLEAEPSVPSLVGQEASSSAWHLILRDYQGMASEAISDRPEARKRRGGLLFHFS